MTQLNYRLPMPKCPHCGHEMDGDEMNAQETDMWALARDEEDANISCPSCYSPFFVRGGLTYHYTSAKTEDEL